MNILETSYKLIIFYYSYVQDYIYKIGKTNYHLQVTSLNADAIRISPHLELIGGPARCHSTSDQGSLLASICFPPNNFKQGCYMRITIW